LGLTEPEDLDLIPSGQNLYCTDLSGFQVLKITADNFTGFVGDILITQESPPALVMVHWDGGQFVLRRIPVTNTSQFEDATFAPIDIPPLP
jgi:hypothetical protein